MWKATTTCNMATQIRKEDFVCNTVNSRFSENANEDGGNSNPINCVMTEWVDDGECSKTCGRGSKRQTRSVKIRPLNGGRVCPTEVVRTVDCNTQPCSDPVDCVMDDWVDDGGCSEACGAGSKRQTRSVRIEPSNGGRECPTQMSRTVDCNNGECTPDPKDCVLSDWSSYGECSLDSSGNCIKQRTRTIETEAQNGGSCDGATIQTEDCDSGECSANECTFTESTTSGSEQTVTSLINEHMEEHGGTPCDLNSIREAFQDQSVTFDASWSDCLAKRAYCAINTCSTQDTLDPAKFVTLEASPNDGAFWPENYIAEWIGVQTKKNTLAAAKKIGCWYNTDGNKYACVIQK